MEYIRLGDLHYNLKSPLPEIEARDITLQILQGLDFMYKNQYAYRDLKPGVRQVH